MTRTRAGVIGLVAGTLSRLAGGERGTEGPKVDALDEATRQPVTGTFTMLDRADQGITSKVRTRARPGHAHTLWYVIFNAPENCSDGICGKDDVFIDPSDHSAGFNAAQIATTQASVVWGNAGAAANRAGRLKLDGALGTG